MQRSTWRDELRIIGAIAVKDIIDAIRNRMTLSIMLGVAVLVLSSMALPLLARLRGTPVAVIYDPGRSALIRALMTRDEFRLRMAASQEEMEATVGGASELALGLVIPEGFKEAAGTGGSVEMVGYVPHWADPDQVAAQVAFFEDVLSEASWQTVSIDVAGHIAYPSLDDMGYPHMVVTSLIIAVMTVGLAMVPYLLLEEKETHTFEALMVSPAQYHQIVMGKALTGLFYCFTAGAVVLALNAQWIVHWWLMAVALGLGAGFAVMLGLLLGSLFDDVSSVTVWMALLLMLLQVPIFLVGLDTSTWPALLRMAFSWLPSVALDKLAAAAMLGSLTSVNLGGSVALLLGSTLLITVVVVWRIRREGR
jgi:ABC-2 type transport system permease protein